MGGGVNIGGINVKVLLYADDIVILSEDIRELQNMIRDLEGYCDSWGLEVNLQKSAIMVFRQGGRLSKKEKWFFRGQEIIIKSEYTYLGVKLTPKMVFTAHLEARNEKALASINATWGTYFKNEKISLKSKWKMYLAICRAIQSYAAQVWGFSLFQKVDKLQHHFLKRILKLPDCTPSYAIHLETGVENAHVYTLELHLRYIHKALFTYSENRLPHKLARKILHENVFWAYELNNLGQNLGFNLSQAIAESGAWKAQCDLLLAGIRKLNMEGMWEKALNSSSRIYKHLDHSIGPQYFKDEYPRTKIMWIFKARVDLIYLNGMYNRNCSLCNLNETEVIQHFLGRCPILKRIRKIYLGREFLSQEQIIDVLNGVNDTNWNNLVKFITDALKYRNLILNEFE